MGSEITGVEIETLCPKRKKKERRDGQRMGCIKPRLKKGYIMTNFRLWSQKWFRRRDSWWRELQRHDRPSICVFSRSVLSDSLRPHRRLYGTAAHQPPLSTGILQQKYRSGLLYPPPGDLPNPGIKHRSPTLQADSLLTEPPGKSARARVTVLEWVNSRQN